MKIYFDGCSVTYGAELMYPEDERYSKHVARHFGAEDYNLARGGGSNRRILRNLLNHNVYEFDMFVIQMTKRARTEFMKDGKWQRIQTSVPHPYLADMYDDEYGKIDEQIMYHAIKNILKDRKHFILTIQHDTVLPIYACNEPYSMAPRGHPNKEGHKFFADVVIRGLEGENDIWQKGFRRLDHNQRY